MTLLVISNSVRSDDIAFPMLLVVTGSLGLGFGLTLGAISTYAGAFQPQRREVAFTALNVLLGLGTALSPLLIAVFLDIGEWWYLPLLTAIGLAVVLVVTLGQPLVAERPAAGGQARPPIPRRFWLFAVALVFYGAAETMFGNWGTTLLVDDGVAATSATYALAAFWAAVTAGRLVIALVSDRVGSTRIYVVLPWAIAVALLIAPAADSAGPGIAVFAFAGLACSGFFPMTIGYGESSFPGMVELAAGWLIAAYQIGYGLAAFGGGALQEAISLPSLFRDHGPARRVDGRPGPSDHRSATDHPIWTMTCPGGLRTVEPGPSQPTMPRSEPCPTTTTSSSSEPELEAAPSPTPWPRPDKRILLLERGNFLPRETENWDSKSVFLDGKYISPDTWYDADGKAFQPQVHYFVGGATKLYGAALYRLRPQDFGELKHADGISPAWPLSYDDFEPWYTKAEWLYQVHGNHGDDPTEGHWSKQYPWPAVSHEPRIQEITDNLAAAGYHPFSAPCGILLDEADRPRSTCIRCTWCDGYPCMVHAKSDAETIAVRPLLMAPNVTLLVEAEVVKLETDPTGGSVTGVVVAARRCARDLHRRHRGGRGRSVEQRQVAPAVGQRSASQRPGQRLGPGRAQLHVPQLQGRGRAVQGAQRHRVPEDPRAQRLLPRRHGRRLAARQHPDGRQVQRLGDEGRGAQADDAGSALEPRRGGRARRRLLADDRGPPGPRQPGDDRRRRPTSTWRTPRTTTTRPTGSITS